MQRVCGLAAIGKVMLEALIIAYGDGRNGKSTFWNTIARVLGTYSGSISADTLTVGVRRNIKPELAEARGKRLLIAAETEEGVRLSTSNVKQLASTDKIAAEKKFKGPFSFTPLPLPGALDFTGEFILEWLRKPEYWAGGDKGLWSKYTPEPSYPAELQSARLLCAGVARSNR